MRGYPKNEKSGPGKWTQKWSWSCLARPLEISIDTASCRTTNLPEGNSYHSPSVALPPFHCWREGRDNRVACRLTWAGQASGLERPAAVESSIAVQKAIIIYCSLVAQIASDSNPTRKRFESAATSTLSVNRFRGDSVAILRSALRFQTVARPIQSPKSGKPWNSIFRVKKIPFWTPGWEPFKWPLRRI